jgi:hypothetical protein
MRLPKLAAAAVALACAAGCGEVNKIVPDAGPGEPDAGVPGEASIVVSNIFGGDPGPVADATALFIDPDGTIATETTTDADGRAVGTIAPGGTLVLLLPDPPMLNGASENVSVAIVGVQPGDAIVFGDEIGDGASLGSMSFDTPVRPSTDNYDIQAGCSSSNLTAAPPIALDVREGCVVDGEFDFLGRAFEGDAIAAFLPGHTTFNDGSSFAPALGWVDAQPFEVSVTDIPFGVGNVRLDSFPALRGREFGSTRSLDQAPVDHAAAYVAPMPAFGQRLVNVELEPDQPVLGPQGISVLRAPDVDRVDLDVSEAILPFYGAPLYSQAEGGLVWNRTSGRSPDVQYAFFFWSETGGMGGGAWFMVLPPDVDRATVPTLPEAYAGRVPVDPESVFPSAIAIEASYLDGYDAARQLGFQPIFEDAILREDPPARLTRTAPPGGGL